MMGWSFRWLAVVAIVALFVGRAMATADVLCNDVLSQFLPCAAFLKSRPKAPSAACCSSLQSLENKAKKSPEFRKVLCECLKDVANSFPINLVKAQKLPKLCKVSDNIKFVPSVNCDKLI